MEPNKKNEEHEFTNPYKSTCHIEKMGLRQERKEKERQNYSCYDTQMTVQANTCHREVYQSHK